MPRTPRTPKTNGEPPTDGAAVAPGDGADAQPDTSAADAARAEFDDDDCSPINPAVKLRLVADFTLERVTRRAARGVAEQRVQINGPGVTAGMSKDDIGTLCGPGEYVLTWRRAPASKRTESGAARPKLENYRISRFSLEWTGAGWAGGAGGGIAGAVAVGASTPGMMPLPTTTLPGERLVPAAFTADESWFAAWQVDAANQRAELVELSRALATALSDSARRATEQAAQTLALAGGMVQAMHAQGEASLQRSTVQAQQLVALQQMAQGSGLEALVGKVGGRMVDRFLPEGPAGAAKPDDIATFIAQVRAQLPAIAEVGRLAPEIKRGLARIDAVTKGLGIPEETPPPVAAASPEGGEPAASPEAPQNAAAEPIAVDA